MYNKLLEQLNELKLELQTLKSNTNIQKQKPVDNVLEKPKQIDVGAPLEKPKSIEKTKVEIKKKPHFTRSTDLFNSLYNV